MKLNRRALRALIIVSEVGVTVAVSILIGLIAGQWLDERFQTSPLFLLLGLLLGLASAGYSLYRLLSLGEVSERKQ